MPDVLMLDALMLDSPILGFLMPHAPMPDALMLGAPMLDAPMLDAPMLDAPIRGLRLAAVIIPTVARAIIGMSACANTICKTRRDAPLACCRRAPRIGPTGEPVR